MRQTPSDIDAGSWLTGHSKVFVEEVGTDARQSMARLLSSVNLPVQARTICIKLNLCEYRTAETGCTSDPQIVEHLISYIRDRYPDSRVILLEGDSTNTTAETLFSYLGITEVAKKFGCETQSISRQDWVRVDIDGLRFTRVQIPKTLMNCDLYITHPKLKTHSLTKISCSLKNQFGCLRPKNKTSFHRHIDEAIVDANLACKPDISIVDADLCMEGIGGPIHGRPKRLGLFIGGRDIVAVDSLCAKVAGFRPFFVGHIRKAAHCGLGRMSFELSSNLARSLPEGELKFERAQYYALKLLRTRLR